MSGNTRQAAILTDDVMEIPEREIYIRHRMYIKVYSFI